MDLGKEARALESLTALLKAAEESRRLFDEAGMAYPEPLRRVLGLAEGAPQSRARTALIPPPPIPARPSFIPASWLWVPLGAMTPQGIVMMILRAANGNPVSVKQIIDRVAQLRHGVNDGSIANIGTRFARDGLIERSDDGWTLTDPSRAPVLVDSHAWGPAEVFQTHELAGRRREAIMHVLRTLGGLLHTQIVDQMAACDWLGMSTNKDMIKMDMLELQKAGRVKRTTGKKWVVSDED